jgi:hypothetical protein
MTAEDSLFTEEERAMMSEAVSVDAVPAQADDASLEDRLLRLAGFVAEGAERERQLRNALKAAGAPDPLGEHADSLFEQMENLTRMVLSGLERERAAHAKKAA